MIKKQFSAFAFYLNIALSLVGYVLLGYCTQRTNFTQLIFLFSFLFAAYFYLTSLSLSEKLIKQAVLAAILIRLSLLFMLPNLSDDYFRFIWDGRLAAHGINPFVLLPSSFVGSDLASSANLNHDLFSSMNSQGYYSVYPPVLQCVFYLSAWLSPTSILGSVVVMRLCIILAEIGSIFVLISLLKKLNLPSKNILLYALNPLVIMELTGNLHFEALMIFFVILSVYFLMKQQLLYSAIIFSLAVCSKLVPLVFLPMLLKQLGVKKALLFYFVCGLATVLLFLPFVDQYFIENIFSSINLYFEKFEFNASIFYLVRWIGFQTHGYDVIAFAGAFLSIIALVVILSISFFRKVSDSIFIPMLLCLSVYFAFATVVHPWYVTSLVALSVFTNYRYAVLWSGLIVLSYVTYQSIPYAENFLIITVEYLVVFGCFAVEVIKTNAQKKLI